jgi:hypothetical protein
MKHRSLLSIVVVVMMIAATAAPLVAQSSRPATQKPATNWTPPKTPWGDPDLQCIYTSDDYINVGLQRQANVGTRLYLTDEEVAAGNNRIETTARNDAQEFANTNGNVGTGSPCHEGNSGMMNQLRAARAQERATQQQK